MKMKMKAGVKDEGVPVLNELADHEHGIRMKVVQKNEIVSQ
jgi:hypothetical protein